MKNYNFNIRTDINRAMSIYNKTQSKIRFTTLDATLLNLLRSFSETKTEFYMSNKELGQILIADPSTVQRSIDKLVDIKLVIKKVIYADNRPKRILAYQKKNVEEVLRIGELFGELHGEQRRASV